MAPAVQSVRFARSAWTTTTARAWLRAHGFVPIKKVDVTATQLRYRIRDPAELGDYITKRLPAGRGAGGATIHLVIGLTETRHPPRRQR
jgi:hypothetical protein